MPFVAVVFLVLALFLIARVPRGVQAVWLGLILFSFGCSILGLIDLITRFGNYRLEGHFILPLEQPGWIWGILSHLSLDDFMRFRLWSLMGFVGSVVGFSLSFTTRRWARIHWLAAGSCVISLAFITWYYDPAHLFTLFKEGAFLPASRETSWINRLYVTDKTALAVLSTLLLFAIGRMFLLLLRSTIQQKRVQVLCVGLGNAMLAVFFIILFCLGPARVLNASSMATVLLPVAGYPVFETNFLVAVPLAGMVMLGLVMFSISRYGFLGSWHVGTGELNRQIVTANQAIRLALHSFKNRFLAIQMAMDMAASRLGEEEVKRADSAYTQIEWARQICREALAQLDALHVQSGRLEVAPGVLRLEDLWREARHRCAGCLGATNISLVNEGDVYVWGDREHLVSVLDNLLQNALDALSQGQFGREPRILIRIGHEFEWGYVRIGDNGPGMPRGHLRKVFRPFFTTKPSKNNWGMGLAYCHRVIKAHRGFINLRSRLGTGTTVEVVLRCREKLDTRRTPHLFSPRAPGKDPSSRCAETISPPTP